MITPIIIILASDFIQHIFLITLAGIAFTEYILAFSALKHFRFTNGVENNMNIAEVVRYAAATRLILIIVAMAVIWFIGEYFFNNASFAYNFFFRWPLALGILSVFVIFMRKNSVYISRSLFSLFAIFLSMYIISDIVDYFIRSPETAMFVAFERIAAILAFFFSFLSYFASHRPGSKIPSPNL